MDFGFSNDPTAFLKVGLCGGELYLDELIYNRRLTNQDIAKWLGELGLLWTDEVIADAQPKCIYEIKKRDLMRRLRSRERTASWPVLIS